MRLSNSPLKLRVGRIFFWKKANLFGQYSGFNSLNTKFGGFYLNYWIIQYFCDVLNNNSLGSNNFFNLYKKYNSYAYLNLNLKIKQNNPTKLRTFSVLGTSNIVFCQGKIFVYLNYYYDLENNSKFKNLYLYKSLSRAKVDLSKILGIEIILIDYNYYKFLLSPTLKLKKNIVNKMHNKEFWSNNTSKFTELKFFVSANVFYKKLIKRLSYFLKNRYFFRIYNIFFSSFLLKNVDWNLLLNSVSMELMNLRKKHRNFLTFVFTLIKSFWNAFKNFHNLMGLRLIIKGRLVPFNRERRRSMKEVLQIGATGTNNLNLKVYSFFTKTETRFGAVGISLIIHKKNKIKSFLNNILLNNLFYSFRKGIKSDNFFFNMGQNQHIKHNIETNLNLINLGFFQNNYFFSLKHFIDTFFIAFVIFPFKIKKNPFLFFFINANLYKILLIHFFKLNFFKPLFLSPFFYIQNFLLLLRSILNYNTFFIFKKSFFDKFFFIIINFFFKRTFKLIFKNLVNTFIFKKRYNPLIGRKKISNFFFFKLYVLFIRFFFSLESLLKTKLKLFSFFTLQNYNSLSVELFTTFRFYNINLKNFNLIFKSLIFYILLLTQNTKTNFIFTLIPLYLNFFFIKNFSKKLHFFLILTNVFLFKKKIVKYTLSYSTWLKHKNLKNTISTLINFRSNKQFIALNNYYLNWFNFFVYLPLKYIYFSLFSLTYPKILFSAWLNSYINLLLKKELILEQNLGNYSQKKWKVVTGEVELLNRSEPLNVNTDFLWISKKSCFLKFDTLSESGGANFEKKHNILNLYKTISYTSYPFFRNQSNLNISILSLWSSYQLKNNFIKINPYMGELEFNDDYYVYSEV